METRKNEVEVLVFMGIWLPSLSQNGPTKLAVWIFGVQPIVPPLTSSLNGIIKNIVLCIMKSGDFKKDLAQLCATSCR